MCTPSVKFITNQTFFTPVGIHPSPWEGSGEATDLLCLHD